MAYLLYLLTLAIPIAIIAQWTDVLGGHSGRLSVFGACFALIGGYSYATLTANVGFAPLIGLILAVVMCAGIAVVTGQVMLRSNPDGLFLISILTQLTLVEIVNNLAFTGGPVGKSVVSILPSGNTWVGGGTFPFALSGFVLFISSFVSFWCTSSRGKIARELHWIRDDEISARAFGVKVRSKLLAVYLALAVFSSLAGILFATSQAYISPGSFGLLFSLQILTAVLLSGTGGISIAVVIGAILLVCFTESVRFAAIRPEVIGPVQQIILDSILVIVLLARRRGLFGPQLRGPNKEERSR